MQVIWNSETQEKLYAINEEALYKTIKKKGRSIYRSLAFLEWMSIVVNLAVGIFLIFMLYQDGEDLIQYITPAAYLAYTGFFIYKRLTRQQHQDIEFEPTMIGEIDKALWQADYLINQSLGMITWYLLPIMIVVGLALYLDGANPIWPLFLFCVVAPAAYFGGKWEVRKFHAPRKRELEEIRKTLTSQ